MIALMPRKRAQVFMCLKEKVRYFIMSTRAQKTDSEFSCVPLVKFRKIGQTGSKYFTLIGLRKNL